MARAALESLAYQVVDLLDAMGTVAGKPISLLAVDGGPTKNPTLMQFQANVGPVTVAVGGVPNASVFGVAALAGWAGGLWPDLEALKNLGGAGAVYLPQENAATREALVQGWREAVGRTRTVSGS